MSQKEGVGMLHRISKSTPLKNAVVTKAACLLTNLNLDSSIKNWIRLLTSWNIKCKIGSVFTQKFLGQGYLRLLVGVSCNQTIKNAIDKLIDQME